MGKFKMIPQARGVGEGGEEESRGGTTLRVMGCHIIKNKKQSSGVAGAGFVPFFINDSTDLVSIKQRLLI